MQSKLITYLLGLIAISITLIAVSIFWIALEYSKTQSRPDYHPLGNRLIVIDKKTGKPYIYDPVPDTLRLLKPQFNSDLDN